MTPYGFSFIALAIVFIALWLLPLRAYYLLIERVLGIQLPRKKTDDENVEIKHPTIDEYDVLDKPYSHWIQPPAFYILLSITFWLCILVIFNNLFLWSTYIYDGGQCPDHMSDCFVFKYYYDGGLRPRYNCTPGSIAAVPNGPFLACYRWVMIEINLMNAVNAVGICGGLVSAFGSITPFIYNLSLNEKCYPYNFFSGALIMVIMTGILIGFISFKINCDLVTGTVLFLIGIVSLFASTWAYYRIKERLKRKVTTLTNPQTIEPVSIAVVSEQCRSWRSAKIMPVSN